MIIRMSEDPPIWQDADTGTIVAEIYSWTGGLAFGGVDIVCVLRNPDGTEVYKKFWEPPEDFDGRGRVIVQRKVAQFTNKCLEHIAKLEGSVCVYIPVPKLPDLKPSTPEQDIVRMLARDALKRREFDNFAARWWLSRRYGKESEDWEPLIKEILTNLAK